MLPLLGPRIPSCASASARLLGCPAEQVFDMMAEALGAGLERRPDTKPSEPAVLDRYERLIEATRLAGREEDAVYLFRDRLGALRSPGEGARGVRSGLSHPRRLHADRTARGPRRDDGPSRAGVPCQRPRACSLFRLGRLAEARALRRLADKWSKSLMSPVRHRSGSRTPASRVRPGPPARSQGARDRGR